MSHHVQRMPAKALLGLCAAALIGAALSARAQEPAVAIVGATLIDGNGGPPVPNAALVVEGKRIRAVGARGSVQIPSGARVIDGTGKFLVPGFIDTNVHLSLYGGWPEDRHETLARYQPRNEELVLESAQLHLKHGVTTVRDSYGQLLTLIQVRDRIARGEATGSRMLVAGNIVGWGGPYSVTFSLIRESGLTLFQEQMNDLIAQGAGEELMDMEPETFRDAIRKYLDKGPDFIKYGGTSHFSEPNLIGFSPRTQAILVEETHRRRKVAETHAMSPEGLRLSIEAGIDLIQHPEILPEEMSDDLPRLIKEKDVICSMLSNTITGKAWQKHLKEQEELSKKKAEAKSDETPRAARTSAEKRKELRDQGHGLEVRRRNAQKLIQAGCRVTIGTDNYLGVAPEFRREPKPENQEMGQGSIIAIEGLVELGMSPAQAIVAATRNGAIACRAGSEYGTLEAGKIADLLLLDADPLADISNVRKHFLIMKEGRLIDREKLPEKAIFSRPTGTPTTNN